MGLSIYFYNVMASWFIIPCFNFNTIDRSKLDFAVIIYPTKPSLYYPTDYNGKSF